MKNHHTISRTLALKITGTVLASIAAGALISAVFFYLYTDRSLGNTYLQRLLFISVYKKEVLKYSIFVYFSFALIVLFGVAAATVLYSHRVSGPLIRIRRFTEDMKQGKFGLDVKFRQEDAVHSLAAEADAFSKHYARVYSEIKDAADSIMQNARQCSLQPPDNIQDIDGAINSITASAKQLEDALKRISV